MNQYTIYLSEEQTNKASELGAPIREVFYDVQSPEIAKQYNLLIIDSKLYCIPTAEQMIGWLRTKGFVFYIAEYNDHVFWRVANNHDKIWYKYDDKLKDPKEATTSAISAALEYLIENKGE